MSHPKYDVFLSFRGEDTRDTFTSHLHAELCRQRIETFIDNRLGRGEEISSALCEAIEESVIYVIILSEHYASSTWCLEELTKILECKERYGRKVIPVFYKVDPSNVRHQRESYAGDLVKHDLRFGNKVDAWKAALTQVANLSGWDSQKTRPDSKLVEKIVKDILNKMSSCVSDDHEGKIAIDKHIEQIQTLLRLESSSVRIIGIWGMGGIGKTEIAGAIYEKLATHFSSRGIVKHVQQEIKKYGVNHVKREYLSHLLDQQDITSSKSKCSFDPRLKRIKVLLVFDDVKDSDQLNELIGSHTTFGNGSRIVVTSRDKQVLNNVNADEIYHVVEMDDKDSLQLFCLNAFKQKEPIETYVSLTEKVLNYAKGVPLVLKVLGSFLQGRAKEAWESELRKLEKNPETRIFNVLKLSYDGLDDGQKYIFLDIACFYRGETEKCVVHTLDCYGFSTHIEMEVLQERCLISILEGRVWMHDRIQEMGHEIVRQESLNNPEKRSRLHKHDDVYDVLKKNKGHGSDAIQSILIDLDRTKTVQLHAETFKKMHNLRMIRCYDPVGLKSGILNSFPDNLKFLSWDYFPQRSLPHDFCPDNLIALDMFCSKLEQLWEIEKILPSLKRLNLAYSEKMIGVLDLSLFPNIEEIILNDCVSLEQVYSSSFLHKLNWLYLDGCTSLKSLSIHSNILSRSTGLVALQGCNNLETILITSATDVVETLIMSRFEGGGYRIQLPSMFAGLIAGLDLSECVSLTSLPAELLNLKFVTRLSLSGCLKLEELPEIEDTMENLKVLKLDKTAIKELPSSLHHLVGLEELSLKYCEKLKTIPSSIGNLNKLLKLDLTYCKSLETFPSSIFKLKLTKLDFHGCSMLRTFPEIPCDIGRLSCLTKILLRGSNIVNLPDSMVHLSSLTSLDLSDCQSLECIPKDIGRLSSLTEILLQGSNIVNLPDSMLHLSSLRSLDLSYCQSLECIPKDIDRLSSLTEILLRGSNILNLPDSMVHLSSLRSLDLRDCKTLKCIPKDIGRLSSLTEILLRGSNIVNLPDSMVHLSSLRSLDLRDCKSLKCIPKDIGLLSSLTKILLQGSNIVNLPDSMVHLSSLTSLDLSDCQSLECIPKDIGRLSSLTEISLRGSNIVNLPKSMVHLSSLQSLDLSDCKSLECIPKDIGRLSSLTEISLRGTNIVNLPESMVHLSSLESLDLSDCKSLECIPKDIGRLSSLTEILLQGSNIVNLPDSMVHLSSLRSLDLRGCKSLECIPKDIGRLSTLTEILLRGSNIVNLPDSMVHLSSLRSLDLRDCKSLKCIPKDIGRLSSLSEILVQGSNIVNLPDSMVHLSSLRSLDLRGCKSLECIPKDIGRLSSLTEILLRGSNIVNLPDSMVHLSSLRSLDLRDCKSLKCIPKDIGRLSSLTKILLQGSNIVNLPDSMVHLSSLTSLDLSDCQSLECIPKDIGRLSFLTKISLRGTNIVNLPESMVHLSSLESLDLSDCKSLECIPKDIGRLSSLTEILLQGSNIVNLPDNMVHLSSLTYLDLSDCQSLECIPKDIGRLSSLTEISLRGTNIVNLPESMVHLSSLESLDLSDCKSLECIPKLPPCLNELLAFDCTSIKKVVPNSLLKRMSYSNDEMVGIYEFHLTNSEELDASSWNYIANIAWIKITDDAYMSALFCFPGSRVPDWFLHHCQEHSITVKNNDEYVCSENRLIGFALCVVFGGGDIDDTRTRGSRITYELSFISDGMPFVFHEKLNWMRKDRFIIRDHTFLWKYQLGRASICNNLIHAQNFTFEILGGDYVRPSVKECGIRPLYIPKNRMQAIFELDA